MKLRNIRTGTRKTLHTDRIRIIHEDNITERQNRNARRAYPVHEDKEMSETQMPTQPLDPFPFYNNDTSDDDNSDTESEDETHTTQTEQPDFSQSEQVIKPESHVQQRYSLRSTVKPQELPLVMKKPIEYLKKKY